MRSSLCVMIAVIAWLACTLSSTAQPQGRGTVPASGSGPRQPGTMTAFVGATILPIAAGDKPAAPIPDGVLVIDAGRIVALGPADATSIPDGARRVDLAGKVIMPGLVDTHNHIGGVGAADSSAPIQPGVRVLDSINPFDSGFRRARAGGLTTLNIMPGSGHLLSGQTIYVKLRPAQTIEDMMIRSAEGAPLGGIKMANGTNPMGPPPFASTRGKAASLVREQFIRAREYQDKIERAGGPGGDPDKLPPRDLGLEALVEAMRGTRIVHHHTHRADDIATVLRLQQEFGFRVVLHHVSEAHKVPEEIAAAQTTDDSGRRTGVLGCSVILIDSPGGKLEAAELVHETAGVLESAGVHVCLHTDDWITDSRLFLRMAALAHRAGMTREGALGALTIEGARQLDLADRVGSLEPGKDADFVILSGDPFSVYTKVEQTWIEGVKVFDLADPEDRLFAEGGFGAGRDQQPYFCCYGNAAQSSAGWVWRSQVQSAQAASQAGGNQ